ncbi:phosphatase PAP2 family protein [Streptomyces sp. NPDC127068]|uniref:phosphatase PAP2 family protein n=1 Tax=Streptomyces sp. NPDC127068 TaxID=3347127 RepID=UPI0036462C2D
MTDFSEELYLDITSLARDSPSWLQHAAEIGTEAGIVVFVALFVAAWWRVRRSTGRPLAAALLAPVATGVAYVLSEVAKTVFDQDRPCRSVAGAAASLVACPERGDWSFPSNHATIAGASAVTLALVWRGLVWVTVPLALLLAFSRVFVGVHFPHDVVVGLVLGAVVAPLVLRLATAPAARVLDSVRHRGRGRHTAGH